MNLFDHSDAARNERRRRAAWLAAVALMLAPCTAFAYFDPNAGGLLYQLLFPLIAAIVSVYVFLKQWVVATFRRMLRAIARLFNHDQ